MKWQVASEVWLTGKQYLRPYGKMSVLHGPPGRLSVLYFDRNAGPTGES